MAPHVDVADAIGASPRNVGPGSPVLAFDVGGTHVKSAVVDADGRLLGLRRTPTPLSATRPAEAIAEGVAALADAYRHELDDVRPHTVGLSVPGPVDVAAGVGLFSSNLGWRDAPVRELAERELRLPTSVVHDVRAAGEAEHRMGAARGADDVVMLTIGTGIAGVVIAGGRIVGGTGFAGEFGHSPLRTDGERCACGARGCLETIASAGAIARHYAARSGRSVSGARQVLEAARSGDRLAEEVWTDAVDALALHLAQLVAALGPELVVLGGGLAEAGDALFGPVRQRLDGLLSFHRRPRLVKAELGEDAGLIGSILAARDLADRSGERSVERRPDAGPDASGA